MTPYSAVRDSVADHPLTPQNAAAVIIATVPGFAEILFAVGGH